MGDLFSQIPQYVKDEVAPYGLEVTGISHRDGIVLTVSMHFVLKGNSAVVKALEGLGWYRTRKVRRSGSYYVHYSKRV